MSELITLGQRLRQLRREARVSLEGMASTVKKETGKGSIGLISFWENDDSKRPVSDAVLRVYVETFPGKTSFQELARLRSERFVPLEWLNAVQLRANYGISYEEFQRYVFDNDSALNDRIDVKDDIHGTPEQWAELTDLCPELTTILMIRDQGEGYSPFERIIGYWQLIPVDADTYDRLAAGHCLDSEIQESMVEPVISRARSWDVYAAAVMLDDQRSSNYYSDARQELFKSYTETLFLLQNRIGFFIRRIVAVPETSGGKLVARMIGMKQTPAVQKMTSYPVFEGNYSTPAGFGKHSKFTQKLEGPYQKHFSTLIE